MRWNFDRLATAGEEDRALAEAGLDSWGQSLDELDRA
jgi:hypothetical protein